METSQIVTGLVLASIPILLFVAVVSIRPLWKQLVKQAEAEYGKKNVDLMFQYAQMLVSAAEQKFDGNLDKKEYVVNQLKLFADELGVEVTYEQIDTLVEASVYQVKKAWKLGGEIE